MLNSYRQKVNDHAKDYFQVAWDQPLHWGEKEKEIGVWAEKKFASETSQKVVREGKGLPPSQANIFPIWPCCLPFCATVEPGPRLLPSCLISLCFKERLSAKPLIRNHFFYSHANETHFHKKGLAQSLILKVRVLGTRNGPFIALIHYHSPIPMPSVRCLKQSSRRLLINVGVLSVFSSWWAGNWCHMICSINNLNLCIQKISSLSLFHLWDNTVKKKYLNSGCSLGIRYGRILCLLCRILRLMFSSLWLLFIQTWGCFQNILL